MTSPIEASTNLNLKKALVHRKEFILKNAKGQIFTLCESTTTDLGINGTGIEMYFVFVKQMILLFSVLSIISFPVLIINFCGGCLHKMDMTSAFEASTIANQKSISLSDIATGKGIKRHKALMYTTVFIDLVYCVVYIGMLLGFEWYNRRRIRRTNNLTVKDFSIMMEMSGRDVTKEELKTVFSKYGPIHECIIADLYGANLRQQMDYINIKKAIIAGAKHKKKYIQKIMNTVFFCGKNTTEKKRDNLKKQCKEMLLCIKQFNKINEIKAFIIFENLRSKNLCIEDFKHKNTFKGVQVKVKSPSNPNELFWENFGIKSNPWKLVGIYSILWLSLIISLVIITIVEYYENKLPTYSRCLEFNFFNSSKKFVPSNETQILCFCGGMEESEIENRDDYSEFCSHYWTYFVQIWLLRFLGSSVISLVNMLLKDSIMALTVLHKHIDNTAEEVAKFLMLFFAQTVNMCCIIFISNLDLSDLRFVLFIQQYVPMGHYFFKGPHKNFSRFWYTKVGMSILALKAIGIIWPQILSIAFMVPICALKSKVFAGKQFFQQDAERCYEKLTINLWDRYASTLANVFFTLIFSSGMPLLLPIQALCFVSQYWIDKALCNFYVNNSCEVCEETSQL